MPEGQVDELVIETTSGEAALDLAPVVFDLYQRVFSLPPFNAGETAIADQQSYFPKLTGRPRFRLTLARPGGMCMSEVVWPDVDSQLDRLQGR